MTIKAKPFEEGILVPLPCFFDSNGDVDYEAYAKHIKEVCNDGVFPVVSGSMGEAVHLDREERKQLIKTAKQAMHEIGKDDVPVMAGAGACSTRESLLLAKDAAEAGADSLIVIPPGYYAGALGPEALKTYFLDIAEGSSLPVYMYNFPGVSGGIDMSSDLIEDIARNSANICGAKLTCGLAGKLGRVAQATKRLPEPRTTGVPFTCMAGFIDFLLPALSVGGKGSVTGVPNFAPKTCMKLWHLCKSEDKKDQQELEDLHYLVSRADWAASSAGIAGMKALLHSLKGTGPNPRKPLLPCTPEQADKFINNPAIQEILKYESTL